MSCVLNKYTHSQNEIELNIKSSVNKLNMIFYEIGYMIYVVKYNYNIMYYNIKPYNTLC